jgi:hypothetical protein
MEAPIPPAPGADHSGPLPVDPHRTALLLEALKAAVAGGGEQRLFRSGKLGGLFPARVGSSAEAALQALQEGLLETVRTESRGKVVTEWVRATPRAIAFIHENDSPKSVLREMKELLASARSGIPMWMSEANQELAALSQRFEQRAGSMLARLEDLASRVEAALRRADTTSPQVTDAVSRLVPWAMTALEYLDRRNISGARGECSLAELFHAVRLGFPTLTLPEFQNGLRRLYDVRAIRLAPAAHESEPEYAMLVGGQMMGAAAR